MKNNKYNKYKNNKYKKNKYGQISSQLGYGNKGSS